MEPIVTSVSDTIGTISLARPQRFNSLDVETARQLRKAGLQMARDANVRVVIVRGEGGVFCSGADLKYIKAGGDPDSLGYLTPAARAVPQGPGVVFKQILEYLHATISEIRRAPKVFIAAVDGIAAAGGMGLALCCDLVFASERATFEWAYSRTGLTGAESNTFLLPKLVGMRGALDLILLNPRLTAAEAHARNLISGVLPTEGFDAAVIAQAKKIAQGPAIGYGVTKGLVNEALQIDRLDLHLDRELQNLVRSADGPEFAAGFEAFLTKKPPRFPGAP